MKMEVPHFEPAPTRWADDDELVLGEHAPRPPAEKQAPPLPWHGEGWQHLAEARGGFFPTVPPPPEDEAPLQPFCPGGEAWRAAAEQRGGFFPIPGSGGEPLDPAACASPMPPQPLPPREWAPPRRSGEWLASDTASVSSQSDVSSAWCGRPLSTPVAHGQPWPLQSPSHLDYHWVGAVPLQQQMLRAGGSICPIPAQTRGRRASRKPPSSAASEGPSAAEDGRSQPRQQQGAAASGAAPARAAPSGFAAVRQLLEDLGFAQYCPAFDATGLDRLDLLAGATDDDLTECGVKPVHRRRILAEAQRRLGSAPAPDGALPGAVANPLLALPTPSPSSSTGGWTPQQEHAAEEWLRHAADRHGAKICVVSCRYQPDAATLCVRYVSADGGAVPRLAALLRDAQAHFLCRVWMGPAREIVDVLNQTAPDAPAPGPQQAAPQQAAPQTGDPRRNPLAAAEPARSASPVAADLRAEDHEGGARSHSAPAPPTR
eukprot:TRINITY_DN21520_c0_g1_i1.p1 TRINITY_DN21520_c0_g1~~TRINITY_DN21520_c0_g1_i1.p1  ORF type:complete len:515 (+),score=159.79 TRINITY_DN21520_c0_g1_i1:85-1545(+)